MTYMKAVMTAVVAAGAGLLYFSSPYMLSNLQLSMHETKIKGNMHGSQCLF